MSKIGLNNFLKKFPDNTKSWRYATDEVRDIARTAKEYYNEFENKKIKACDFSFFATPADWNKKGKRYINMVYSKMNANTKKKFNAYLKHDFNIN